ncbi:MAG TPA: ABC transporter ATP-binding protein [Terriglobales bacterium]|nr:ABC transporter ATP-binding protein [Terriglobales bacterium]
MRAQRETTIIAEKTAGRSGAKLDKPERKAQVFKALPEIWGLMRPRRGLLALGFVLMAINRLSGLVLPPASKFLLDTVIGKHQMQLLLPLIGVVMAATIVQGVTSYTLTQTLSKAAQRMIAELREKVQEHVGRLPVAYYDANKTGMLVSRIMSDVEGVRNLIGTGLVDFVGGLLTATIAFVILLKISFAMTMIAFGALVMFGFVLRKAFKYVRPIFRERAKINAEVTGRLTETLGGVRVVKGYHAEDREHEVFAGGVQRLLQNVFKSLTAVSLMGLSSAMLMGMVGAVVMYMGARLMIEGKLTSGGYLEYIMLLGFLAAPLFQVVGVGTQITEAIAGLERTKEVLGEHPEDEDPERTVTLPEIVGDVRFEDVSFAYDPAKTVLHDISFHAQPGTVTALVGSSGSGKSTIIGLIAAFHKPSAVVPTSADDGRRGAREETKTGRVLVDGVDLSTVRLDSYRSQLGVVLQESFLFDGTIRENIAFSRPGANEEQILSACRIARVDEFAEGFPDKYDTIIGERGVKLSGGQRQRVSIARAILADPRILILDEATSSLDSESEALIQEGLSYLMRGRTTFVIAHRLSTIRRAEQILVVEDGRIVERGNHEELYALQGRYFELYTKQHGLQENLFLAPGEGEGGEQEEAEAKAKNGNGPDPVRILRGESV